MFLKQCSRRFGRKNPERLHLEHWEWMVRSREDPYHVRERLGIESNFPMSGRQAGRHRPDFCFVRFGMSRTPMPDGRIICVGGEHEDWYDPDFCIYNDVVVLRPAPGQQTVTLDLGEVEIYAYPESEFAPTDFHSATLVGDRLILIGRVGYDPPSERCHAPVYAVDATTYHITRLDTRGQLPGWLYEHHASFDAARYAISVRGGKVFAREAEQGVPNRTAYRLWLDGLRWELLNTQEEFRMFRLDEVRSARYGACPTPDAFRPQRVPHAWLLPEERGVDVYRLDVQGVRIEFEVYCTEVRMTVEGTLPQDLLDTLIEDIVENLNSGGAEWEWTELDPRLEW